MLIWFGIKVKKGTVARETSPCAPIKGIRSRAQSINFTDALPRIRLLDTKLSKNSISVLVPES
jgi:hypothetical protein